MLQKGKPYYSENFIIKKLNTEQQEYRVGFVISKKVSKKAVLRNKLRRQLVEVVKKTALQPGQDIVIIPKNKENITNLKFQELKTEVQAVIKKIGK